MKTFEIAIQLGAILSVVVLYWRSLVIDREMAKRVVAAFIPTALIGLILYKFIKSFLLGSETIVIWSLLFGGIFIIVFEMWYQKQPTRKEEETISYTQAFIIGLIQALAVVPGVSRSAATIIAGLSMGLSRRKIVEFSFLLAIPTMAAAVALDLLKSALSFTGSQVLYLLVGFTVSFAAAILAVKFLLSFIKRNNFILFGIYRIILAILFLAMYRL
ncbi:MAG: undecaprenyl-diphosphate phosphatase [Candidatus Omnitrophica bacterium]|nr:undecaprenyl-diphosphate phosphatase [Candidatus Omnitrophota bacterium]